MQQKGKSGKNLTQLCRGLVGGGGVGLSHESLRKRQVTCRADGRLANS